MTVNELIEKLKEFNGSEEVMIDIENYHYDYEDGVENEWSEIECCIITNIMPDMVKNIVKLEYK